MAKLFPTQNPAEIDNDGERKMATALVEQLPDRVEIFHSFDWLDRNSNGALREGECDFLLLDPQRGMLFVEVKGGYLRFDGAGWVQNEVPTDKDPFAQAKKGMHAIEARVKKRFPRTGAADLPFTRAFAVAFPNCRFSGALPPSVTRELILDAPRLDQLEDAVNRCFAAFRRRNTHRSLSERETQAIREALYPRYELLPVTWRKLENQEARLQRLTAEQKRLLDVMTQLPRVAIQGVAGSGKTLLALAKAQEMAQDGRRTALLCYNKPLKEWLRRSAPAACGDNDNLVIDTYHGLMDALCQAAGMSLPTERDQDFWNNRAPEALMEACERLDDERKFEVVIVDEGQDFHELWWTSLDSIFRNPAEKAGFYVFHDPRQNLYVADPSLPEGLMKDFELTENCRNTVRIAEHCAGLAGYQSRHRDGAPEGDEPQVAQVETLADAFQEAGKRVQEWCAPERGGLAHSQAAVLAPGFTRDEWPADLGGIPLTQNFEQWERGEGVLLASWHHFKGLEADAVIIIEAPMRNEAKEKINRYVAHSRAKHLLMLIEVVGQ